MENILNQIVTTVDRAAATLHEGLVSEALGWRGAVLFFVLLGGLFPFASLVNALWVGLVLVVNWGPSDLNLSVGEFYSLCTSLILCGMVGVWLDIRAMSKRPKVDRESPHSFGD